MLGNIYDVYMQELIIGASVSEHHSSELNYGFFIGASVSEPHTSEFYCIYICIYIYKT